MIDPVRFAAGGVSYELAFGIAAMKRYQRAHGETVTQAFSALGEGDMVRVGNLFQVACRPQVDEETTDAIIDEIGLAAALEHLKTAASEAFKGLTEENPPPAR
jgi:hypothetical protein